MIWHRICEWARVQPAKSAIVYNDVPLDYASFARAIGGARGFLAKQDLPPGRTAIVLVSNPADAWVLALALRTLGLDTVAVESIAQAERLAIGNVACVAMSEAEQGAHRLKSRLFAGTKAIFAPKPVHAGIRAGDLPAPPQTGPGFGGHILYTSGTTGTYKKVLLKGALEEKRNAVRARTMSFSRDTVHHGLHFGLWTGAGFKQPAAAWHSGGTIVLDDRPDLFDNFFRHGITSTALLPPMFRTLLDRQAALGHPRTPRTVEIGLMSGFLPLELAERTTRELNARVIVRYSATELVTIPIQTPFRTRDDLDWLPLFDDGEAQIVREDGGECRPGEEGELRIALTDCDCDSYLGDAAASAKMFRDGFFHPGDMAVRRADGRIRILGRTADVLNVQGQKTAVAPIEQAIRERLGANEVCLFSGLNDSGKEELVIAVEAQTMPPRADLDAVAKEFSVFESVRCVVLRNFPRTETGTRKTKRATLRRMVFAKAEENA